MLSIRRIVETAVLLVVLIVVAGVGAYVFGSEPDYRYVSADFTGVDGLYQGADVKILGVAVGEVTAIHGRGTYVQVEMRYESAHPLPTGVHAVLVQPSVVGDRYIQFAPAYTGGAQLADHARLPLTDTEVPVTLDQTYRVLDQLAVALAPNRANGSGALADVIKVAADNLAGNGTRARSTITDLSRALSTLSSKRGDITASIDNLATLTGALAADDPQVRRLATNLALVSQQLDAQRGDLTSAVDTLGPALAQVSTFVRTNRRALVESITHLARASGAVAAQRADLAEILRVAPLAVTNLDNAYNPQNWDPAHPDSVPLDARLGALQSRANFFNDLGVQLGSTLQGVCATLLGSAAQGDLKPLCTLLTQAGDGVGSVLGGLLGGIIGGTLTSAAAPSSLSQLLLGGTS